MNTFEIIHRVNGNLRTCTVEAFDAADAQERFVELLEAQGRMHGEIINIEEI